MAINYEQLGKRIKHFREKAGISQDELGRRVLVNNVHISNIETGKKDKGVIRKHKPYITRKPTKPLVFSNLAGSVFTRSSYPPIP